MKQPRLLFISITEFILYEYFALYADNKLIIQNNWTLRSLLLLNIFKTSSITTFFSRLDSKARKARFRIRSLVMDTRDGMSMRETAENDASHMAELQPKVSIMA